MDSKPNIGQKRYFRKFIGTQPVLLADGTRYEFYAMLESGNAVRLGESGTVASGLGALLITTGSVLQDKSSGDAWWGVTSSGSGTVSGYVVV